MHFKGELCRNYSPGSI